MAQLRALGHEEISLVEVPGGEHQLSTMGITPGNPQFDAMAQRYRTARRAPWPRRVRHHARDSASGRAHWVQVEGLEPGRTATVEAEVVGPDRVDVRATACARVRLHLSDRLLVPGLVLLTVNGRSPCAGVMTTPPC
ncbi:hypothetical protein ACOBQX_08275 [Actinokineospora sp. G85]|uniref:hypothetical protein n=1 Tax=Actinokineospora sp. G85 TaxID=3406626 RepID=UPI003C76B553